AFAAASHPAIAQLKAAGSQAEVLHLPDHGVFGNGHGLIYEKNSDAALAPVLNWLAAHTEAPNAAQGRS
ncbi:lysophospholipase, partial [Burkholderia sp. Ac-20379]|nr:lysophospholipase [Burkholderia sp. Ac-20379]